MSVRKTTLRANFGSSTLRGVDPHAQRRGGDGLYEVGAVADEAFNRLEITMKMPGRDPVVVYVNNQGGIMGPYEPEDLGLCPNCGMAKDKPRADWPGGPCRHKFHEGLLEP